MAKILIFQDTVRHYRYPIFNLINEKHDLTICVFDSLEKKDSYDFDVLHVGIRRIGRFTLHTKNLHTICSKYDVVIGPSDIGWLSIIRLLFKSKRKYKLILWGIGLRASYKNNYGTKTKWDKLRFYLLKKADAIIFYSQDPIKVYEKQDFNKKKLFVANNTIKINENFKQKTYDYLLFVGTLYKEKKIFELLNSYLEAHLQDTTVPQLTIIGDGNVFDEIKNWISNNELKNKITLTGKITDQNVLANYFNNSIACISPGQAGLTVLMSMGYGVPFITKENAITGGEIKNITSEENGILYKFDNELTNIILDIHQNRKKYIKLGQNAKTFYSNYRKPENMAAGFFDAIEFVLT